MATTLDKGEVKVMLAGEERTLKPTLDAFNRLSKIDYRTIIDKISEGHVPTMTAVLHRGLGLTDKQALNLSEQIFNTGIPDLQLPLINYVFRLYNAGKSPKEVEEEMKAAGRVGEEEGNGTSLS